VLASIALSFLAACGGGPTVPVRPPVADTGTATETSTNTGTVDTGPVDVSPTDVSAPPREFEDLFDVAPDGGWTDGYRVVGATEPGPTLQGTWGRIELLEGLQVFRTEGHNRRTAHLRWMDTWQDALYPVQTYMGALNQQIVDAFNLHYASTCAGTVDSTDAPDCPAVGPTRPEARFVLLHHGPRSAALDCDTARTPVLFVHGAMQDANAWLFPGGTDGDGGTYPGTPVRTGFVQDFEAAGLCSYALTFSNSHGDNFGQATHLHNAIGRIRELTGAPRVDVIAWSKGSVASDLYLADTASWDDWGPKWGERLAAESARRVPHVDGRVRAYVTLSGPHRGIDMNWRHPYNNLLIASTPENTAFGRGPMAWGSMMAAQCATFAAMVPELYAQGLCRRRGEVWTDFWSRIHLSNLTGLDEDGAPVSSGNLESLNRGEGALETDFDANNLAMWGSVGEDGVWTTAYLGQLQVIGDFREAHPIPARGQEALAWSAVDTDEGVWRPWVVQKLAWVPATGTFTPGTLLDDDGHTTCRASAFDPATTPCEARHGWYDRDTELGLDGSGWRYRLFDGIGLAAARELGGNVMERLAAHGLTPQLDYLLVLHGTRATTGAIAEHDGMACPTCDPSGDGVLFEESIAARDQLVQGWSERVVRDRSKEEGVAWGHTAIGLAPPVGTRIRAVLGDLPRP
jgi:hypothetical protein